MEGGGPQHLLWGLKSHPGECLSAFDFTGNLEHVTMRGKNPPFLPDFSCHFPRETPNRSRKQPQPSRVFLGQESRRTKVSRVFRIFVPNFAPNFAPNFPLIFQGLSCFVSWETETRKKFTKNPRHFSMQNSQGANTKKIFTTFFWRAGKVKFSEYKVAYGVASRGGGTPNLRGGEMNPKTVTVMPGVPHSDAQSA